MKSALRKYPLWLVTFLSFLLYSFIVNVLGPSLPSIKTELQLDDGSLGLIASLFAIGGLSAVIGGYLSDRRGRAFVGSVSLGVLGASSVLMGTSTVLPTIVFALLLMGVAAGFFSASVNAMIASTFSEVRGMAMNLLHVAWNIGSSVAPPVTASLIVITGSWRVSYMIPIPLLIAVGLLLYRFRNLERNSSYDSPVDTSNVLREMSKVLPIAMIAPFILALELGVSFWLPSVMLLTGFTLVEGGTIVGVFWGMMGVGRLVLGPLTDRWGYRNVITVNSILTLITLLIAWSVPVYLIILGMYAAAGFFLGPVYPTTLAWINSLNPRLGGSLSGFLYVLGTCGIFISTVMTGFMIQITGPRLAQLTFFVFAGLIAVSGFLGSRMIARGKS
ncbi:MAG: MFS transporter [Aigarchaeota archaeon]|nr:MFS transporter [Aigarchaeota archaeon]MDW8092245.1 MFS transporter [Nitrososphaerota archaeon]